MILAKNFAAAVRVILAGTALLIAWLSMPHPACAEPPAAIAELRAEYAQLAKKFAADVPGWQPAAPATGNVLFVAPDQYTPAAERDERFELRRAEFAEALFRLAKRAAEEGQSSLAFQWATEAVREDPDHVGARRVLGYEQRDGKWLTAYGARMFDAGKVWRSGVGWVAAEGAKPPAPGTKPPAVSGKQEVLRSDHFTVSTNHSLAAAAELIPRLERLYQIWRQLFAGFYYNEKEVRQLFAGERAARKQARPFKVIYHRNRDEYIVKLRRYQPRIGETLGIYFDTRGEAHFFDGAEQDPGTLYHEAVHQLFWESKKPADKVATMANFWILEGVATYFETLTEHDDPTTGLYYTIGEWTAGPRLPAARDRLAEGFYIPLDELTRMGKFDVQGNPEVKKLYGQAAGLTAFLIDGEDGRYREPLVRYLQEVYAGRATIETLSEVTGTHDSDLDAAYRRYVESLP